MHDIFTFVRRGIGPNGRVVGTFRPTGIRPRFLEKLRVAGIVFPADLFDRATEVS
jgi:pilus assembly protein CpaF